MNKFRDIMTMISTTPAPVDPSQLLKALNPLLGHKGEIKGPTEAVRIASLMKDAVKLVSRCIYINILKITEDNETMDKFMSVGGWDTLNDWLQDIKEEENYPVMTELLKVYQSLPVTVDILKTNNAAKTIKQLCKSENEDVKNLADTIFEAWMKKVKGNNNNNESKSKKKKKDKEKDKEKEKEKSSKKEKEGAEKESEKLKSKDADRDSDKSKSKESKSQSLSSSRDSNSSTSSSQNKDKDTERDRRKEKSGKIRRVSGDDSPDSDSASDDVPTVKQGSGLKLKFKLGGDRTENTEKEKKPGFHKSDFLKSDKDALTNDSKKRASTVKRPPSKFRSTGLEEESTMLPPKTKPPPLPIEPAKPLPSKPIPKRSTGSEEKSEPPLKKSRLHVTVPPPSLPSPTITTPTHSSPTSPGEMHGRIKIIPARPRPNHEIHESTGFMDSLERTSTVRTYGQFKKKKKAAAAVAGQNMGQKSPTTPPSPISPTTAVARSLPSVPSFYKDTLQDEPSPDKKEIKKEIKKERSPSPEEDQQTSGGAEVKMEEVTVKQEIKTEDEIKMEADPEDREFKREDSEETLDSLLEKEAKGLLTTGATKKKRNKKRVSWKEESELKEFFYFELDEDERENVNRPKDFNQAKKNELLMDRKMVESSRRLINDMMSEQIAWYRPKVVAGIKPFEAGKESQERDIQKAREQGVLQALFFDKNMLPGTPAEPELEHEEVTDPKLIPLEDSSGGDEYLYNYEEHAQAVPPNQSFPNNQPPSSLPNPTSQPPLLPPPMGPPGQMPPHGMMPPPGSMPPPGPMPPPPQGSMMPPGPMGPGLNLPPGVQLPPDVSDLLNMLQNKSSNPDDPLMQNVQQILNNIMGGGSEHSYEQLQQIMNQQMGIPPGMMQGPPPGPPPMGPGGPRMGPPPTGLLGNAPPGFMPQRPMGPPPGFGPPVSGPGGPMQGSNNPNWGQQNMGGPPGGPNMGMPSGPPPNQGFNQQQFRGRMRGPGPRGPVGPPPPRNRVVCRHFLAGPNGCRLGNACGFRHVIPAKKKDRSKKDRRNDGPPKLDSPAAGSPPQQKFDGPPKLKQEVNTNMSPPR